MKPELTHAERLLSMFQVWKLNCLIKRVVSLALENGQITVAVFCDISKAFDRLWHKGLIEKLKSYGINGKLLQWLKDYISERKQQVLLTIQFPRLEH
jgi:hypothetical protein